MNNVEFYTLEMIPSSRFKKFSKRNGERRRKRAVYPQAGWCLGADSYIQRLHAMFEHIYKITQLKQICIPRHNQNLC